MSCCTACRRGTASACSSPSPSPNRSPKNLSRNELGEIARFLSPRNRRALSMATSRYTRKTLPIGLSVTKVGAPAIQIVRPPVINRSRAVAKASPLRFSKDVIDRSNPAAYKNNTWQFYLPWARDYILFTNTRNGRPFIIDKKTGARKPVPVRLGVVNGPLQFLQARKPGFHTWSEYIKRSMKNRRLVAGTNARNAKYRQINTNVRRLIGGNHRALNRYSVSNLVWWANPTRWMQMNGVPYVKYRGRWTRYGANSVLTKNNIINNIHLQNNARR